MAIETNTNTSGTTTTTITGTVSDLVIDLATGQGVTLPDYGAGEGDSVVFKITYSGGTITVGNNELPTATFEAIYSDTENGV